MATPATMTEIWEDLRDLFEIDDGFFPEICLPGLSAETVIEGYAFLRGRARYLVGSPVFFDRHRNGERSLDAVSNPAALVTAGEASPFHFLARQVTVEGLVVPEVGLYVFPNALAFDYQPGRDWQEPQMTGLFHLLQAVTHSQPDPGFRLEEDLRPGATSRFRAAFAAFRAGLPAR